MELGYYKINGDALPDPSFATEGSAAFDLRADLTVKEITGFAGSNGTNKFKDTVVDNYIHRAFTLPAAVDIRWMIPSGLILDIPIGYHVKTFIRGGTGLKTGLRLANGTGIIDDDYTDETFILVQNISGVPVTIIHGDRIAQAMLRKNIPTELERRLERPVKRASRSGGFNSTGKQ